jgi:hypothetical protein
MAAVTRVKARPCSPAGYEVNDKGLAAAAWVAGDLLKNTAAGWRPLAGADDEIEPDGIGLQDAYAGQGNCSIGIHGEMDGFSGLTAGTPLYPSATVAGGLDTTAVTGAAIRVKAVTTTRIRYNFV